MKKNKKKTVKTAEKKKRKTARPEKVFWHIKTKTGRFNDRDFTSTVCFFDNQPVSVSTLYAGVLS